jgi:RNA polymerase sigma factor (sigma-70 family)
MQGHPLLFPELYEQYKSKVFNTVISYLQNAEDAEEVTQDVFVEIHHSLDKFEGRSSPGTWIYRISVNRSLDFIRARKRKKRAAFITSLFNRDTGELQYEQADFVHPGITLENKERSVFLFKAIHSLPENQQTAFILARIEGLGNIEIAGIMELKVGAVESLLSRAKDNLRKKLENILDETKE